MAPKAHGILDHIYVYMYACMYIAHTLEGKRIILRDSQNARRGFGENLRLTGNNGKGLPRK